MLRAKSIWPPFAAFNTETLRSCALPSGTPPATAAGRSRGSEVAATRRDGRRAEQERGGGVRAAQACSCTPNPGRRCSRAGGESVPTASSNKLPLPPMYRYHGSPPRAILFVLGLSTPLPLLLPLPLPAFLTSLFYFHAFLNSTPQPPPPPSRQRFMSSLQIALTNKHVGG